MVGILDDDLVLDTDTEYQVLTDLTVPSDKSLTLPEGAVLKFLPDTRLIVEGTVITNGSPSNPILLQSAMTGNPPGAWSGLQISSALPQTLSHIEVSGADDGLSVTNGAEVTLNSVVFHGNNTGAEVLSGSLSLSASKIHDNYIGAYASGSNAILNISSSEIWNNGSGTQHKNGSGIRYHNKATGAVSGSLIWDNTDGVEVTDGASPTIHNGNEIHGNQNGIRAYIDGSYLWQNNPYPVVTGNKLFNNGLNYYTSRYNLPDTVVLDATGNYWGTEDPLLIQASVDSGNSSQPRIDFSSFRNSNLQPLASKFLAQSIDVNTQLDANSSYYVLQDVLVAAGALLSIPEGVVIEFLQGSSLIVNGAINVSGTETSPVIFSAPFDQVTPGSWQGIVINQDPQNVQQASFSHVRIEGATKAIQSNGVDLVMTNSVIIDSLDMGIEIIDANGFIAGNLIDNGTKSGTCIALTDASPIIIDNTLQRCEIGIAMTGQSNPSIFNNSIINNKIGIQLNGSIDSNLEPQPIIQSNDIYDNDVQVVASDYGDDPLTIDFTQNWWGSDQPDFNELIQQTNSQGLTIDSSSPRSSPNTLAASIHFARSRFYFSPVNTIGAQDVQLTGTLNQAVDWEIRIRNSKGTLVKSLSGTGSNINEIWDGKNDAGSLADNGKYDAELRLSGSGKLLGSVELYLDAIPPTLSIDSPTENQELINELSVSVQGMVNDDQLVSYSLDVGFGDNPANYNDNLVSGFQPRTGELAPWLINSRDGSVGLSNGDYTLKLTAQDKAGNVSTIYRMVTINQVSLTEVAHSSEAINPLNQEHITISYVSDATGTLKLRIYQERFPEYDPSECEFDPYYSGSSYFGGNLRCGIWSLGSTQLVYEAEQQITQPGPGTFIWNGKNQNNEWLEDGAYFYELELVNGDKSAWYAPNYTEQAASFSSSLDADYNTYKNDFWKGSYTFNEPVRISVEVTPNGKDRFFPIQNKIYPTGQHTLIWNGRDHNDRIVADISQVVNVGPYKLRENSIIIEGMTPQILGTKAAPNIEVLSDPYLVVHSYEQVSKVRFTLNQDALVSFAIVDKYAASLTDSSAIFLLDGEFLQAEDQGESLIHEVTWRGYASDDTNNIKIPDNEDYQFLIEAVSSETGIRSTYRGTITLHQ